MFYKRFVFGGIEPETEECLAREGRPGREAKTAAAHENRPGGRAKAPACEDRSEGLAEGAVYVRAADLYDSALGYGFVTEKNRREQDLLRVPELNAAFDAAYWYQDQDLTMVEEDRLGCFLDSCGEIARLEDRKSVV